MKIRKFKKEDAKQCSKLILECIEKNLSLNEKNKKFMIKKSQPKNLIEKSEKLSLFVYDSNGEILGTGALDKNEIRTMFVKPKMQVKGIGKKILNFLINKAQSKGLKKVWLKSSPEAEIFYKKQGFKKIKVRNDYNFKTIEMEKENKMKTKIKSLIWKTSKIIWFIIGGLILFFTLIFLIKMQTAGGLGVITVTLLFAVGIYAIGFFIIITLLFLLIKWVIKKFRRANGK